MMIETFQPIDVRREVRRAAGGPFPMGRRCPGGFRHRPPPAVPPGTATGIVTLNSISAVSGTNGTPWYGGGAQPDGSMQWTHDLLPGANRVAVLMFSMRAEPLNYPAWEPPGISQAEDREYAAISNPPALVAKLGTKDLEFISYNVQSSIYHGWYWAGGISQTGPVTVTFHPGHGSPSAYFWCMLHMFVFNGAVQSAPLQRLSTSAYRTATDALPYNPEVLTTAPGSWVLDSLSMEGDISPRIPPPAGGRVLRTTHEIRTWNDEFAWLRAHSLTCTTVERASVGTYAHNWAWSGGLAISTYLAVEIRPAS